MKAYKNERLDLFNLDQFINQIVIKRQVSMFYQDIEAYKEVLSEKIEGKSVLVIGVQAYHVTWGPLCVCDSL